MPPSRAVDPRDSPPAPLPAPPEDFPSCPWDGLEPVNLELFCEARTCSWIETPANTWSNVGYLVVGVLVLVLAARRGGPRAPGLVALAVFAGSSFMHASGTFYGALCDVGSMLLFMSWLLMTDLDRWLDLGRVKKAAGFFALMAIGLSLLVVLRKGSHFFGVEAGAWIVLQLVLWRRGLAGANTPTFQLIFAFFAVAWSFWWLDVLRVWCNPDNHAVQGHALWHLLNAPCFLLAWEHYRRYGTTALPPELRG